MGIQAVREGYRHLVHSLGLEAIVLFDGGTDILMRGDEAMLGTPGEDIMSLAAVAGLDVPPRIVTCLGFGVDCHHGLSHANWLETVAALMQTGGFLGAIALRKEMPEVQAYIDAVNVADTATPGHPSIVNGSVVSAIEGYFGDYHCTHRTRESKLFISPLMSIFWAFDLAAVAKRNLNLDCLEHTRSIWDVLLAIESLSKRSEGKVGRAVLSYGDFLHRIRSRIARRRFPFAGFTISTNDTCPCRCDRKFGRLSRFCVSGPKRTQFVSTAFNRSKSRRRTFTFAFVTRPARCCLTPCRINRVLW